MSGEVLRDMIRFTNINERPPLQAFFEEDVLVPDIKPDVARIGASRVIPRLAEKESYGGSIRLGGDLYLEVVYTPSASGESPAEVVSVRIPFRHEGEAENVLGETEVIPRVDHLEVSIINERKLRMKTVVSFQVREYEDVERNLFRGFREETVEVLPGEVNYTNVAEHKKDYIEVKDEAGIREGMPEIGCVLKTDFRAAETYRQISADKAIISGTLYYDILYLSEESDPEPVPLSGKTDFTQFIKLEGTEPISGSDVFMRVDDVRVVPKRDEEDNMTIFEISVGISTRLDVYSEKQAELVQDAYHHSNIMDLEKDEVEIMRFGGSGSADLTVREKVDLHSGAEMEKVVFTVAEAFAAGGEIEDGKFIAEGILAPELLYCCAEEKGLRSTTAEIPFRTVVEVPGLKKDMEVSVEFVVRRASAEKINDRQAEITAEIGALVKCCERDRIEYIKNAGMYEEVQNREDNTTRLILYITRNNDRLWDIGKRYRTPLSDIKRINGIDDELSANFVMGNGEKLLIWA